MPPILQFRAQLLLSREQMLRLKPTSRENLRFQSWGQLNSDFSFVGFEQREIAVGNQNSLNVSLAASTSNLNEVVVTGYTTQRKKDIIGAVSVVSANDLKATPASNLAVQLQGRAAGVTVSSAGEPGAGAVVRIRGFASAGNNDPLYIIDGVPTDDPSKINPNDIESLQVLKDASSASIYGSEPQMVS